jgi:hypothetical protein
MRSQNTLKKSVFAAVRGAKNPWDPIMGFPYTPSDEHVEPKDEEIIQEIFDKNYYHYFYKGTLADSHAPVDNFTRYKQWQHLYVTPK